VTDGAAYDVDGTAGSATVNVADDDDPPVPTVSITAGSDVVEGSAASFTVSASPAPSAALTVTVNVAASGDFGVTTGSRTVTVPTSGSVALAVATTGDSTDEADGSVTVTVTDGAAYDVDGTAGSATVNIADDDDPPAYVVPASLISNVRGYAAETANGDAHVGRWKRVLLAFGESVPGFTGTPMTLTEAQDNAQAFWSDRWDPVVTALQKLAANPQQQSPPVPVVSVSAGSGVVEGSAASFTVSASPAPSAALTVTVNVTASGDFGVTTGSRTVTIPTSGSATLTVATTGDSTDEVDGSVTVTVTDDTGYDVSSTAGAATVNVADDDDPPPPADAPVLSVGDVVVGEGGWFALLTVRLSKPAAQDVTFGYATATTGFGAGHATLGADFKPTGRGGKISKGQTRTWLSITVRDDSRDEPDETFKLVLSGVEGAVIGDGEAIITIKDDD